MRNSITLIALGAIVLAGGLAFLGATVAASRIEASTEKAINSALAVEGIQWAKTEADGLLVRMYGTAPNEAVRFRALTAAGRVIDAARILDQMDVTPSKPIAAPEFSLELLRNDAGISMIGLLPSKDTRAEIKSAARDTAKGQKVTDMTDTATYPAPDGWAEALEFGLKAMEMLPRSKISVTATQVSITAISDSADAKRKLEAGLMRIMPDGIEVAMEISAPRPVITPFTLRVVHGPEETRFDACSADTPEHAERILAAATQLGIEEAGDCIVGLGVPTPEWTAAVETGIAALAELGGGTLTFADADVSLVALDTTPQDLFDRIIGELEADLPEVFSLHSVLPEPVKLDGAGGSDTTPEFLATRSPEGLVQLRGRVTDDLVRAAAESYAQARFGIGNTYAAMRLDPDLPDGWPLRVLTGLEGLAELSNGSVFVQPAFVELRGVTGDPEAQERVSRLFADKLGDAQNFNIEIEYREALDPEANQPEPVDCIAEIQAIQGEQKITFEPGSVTLQGDSLAIVDRIADVLAECRGLELEIGGHTDSQGREEMNQSLSQQRADAVLNALLARRVLTSNITAKGYGESVPIADNETEEGREANRRIEFRHIADEAEVEATEDDSGDGPDGAEQATDEAADTAAEPVDQTAEDGSGDDAPQDDTTAPDEGSGD